MFSRMRVALSAEGLSAWRDICANLRQNQDQYDYAQIPRIQKREIEAKDGKCVLPRGICLGDVGAAKDRRQLLHIRRGHHTLATVAC